MSWPLTSRAVRGPKATEARTEAMRVLRSNLLVAVADLDHPVVVVTSANPAEGKTATCVGLARSLAVAGRRVVLVDLDLRHPELHERLGVPNDVGVVDVVTGSRTLADVVRHVEGQGFYVVPAGPSVPNATELLGTDATSQLLDTVASQADIVLVDSAPVLPVADTLVVARKATGALLVVEAGRTSQSDVLGAREALERAEVRVLGVALNKLDAREVRLGYGGGGAPDLNGSSGIPTSWAPSWAAPSA